MRVCSLHLMCYLMYLFVALPELCGSVVPRKPLQGRHLRVLPLHVPPSIYVIRNATGHVVGMEGFCAEILYWLASSLGFTYSLVDTAPGIVYEDSPSGRGWKSYVLAGEADFVIGPIAFIASRLSYLDFTYPTYMSFYQLLIPSSEQTTNFGAPWKPFSTDVWIVLFISIPIMTIIMTRLNRYVLNTDDYANSEERHFDSTVRATDYVIQVLLAQGSYCPPRRLNIRMLAGVWCLASFFLVNFYYSTFISYASASNRQPIVDELSDLPKNQNVRVTVNYGWAIDFIISSADSGTLKYLREMLNRDPSLRCKSTDKCVDKVKKGSTVYINSIELLASIIDADVRKTGECHLTVAKDKFLPQLLGFVYPKHSKYRDHIDNQIIRLWETGLSSVWNIKFSQNINKCLQPPQQTEGEKLGLNNLSSAFILIIFGYGIALITAVLELIVHRWTARKLRTTYVIPIAD